MSRLNTYICDLCKDEIPVDSMGQPRALDLTKVLFEVDCNICDKCLGRLKEMFDKQFRVKEEK